MYQVGDKVLHQFEGACYINRIENKQMGQNNHLYYVLEPITDSKSTIYVSIKNHDRIRVVISKSDLKQSESKARTTQYIWPDDPKERYQEFAQRIETFDFEEVMQVFISLTLKNEKKKLGARDEQQRKISEKLFCSEVAIILNKSYQFVATEITKYLLYTAAQTA